MHALCGAEIKREKGIPGVDFPAVKSASRRAQRHLSQIRMGQLESQRSLFCVIADSLARAVSSASWAGEAEVGGSGPPSMLVLIRIRPFRAIVRLARVLGPFRRFNLAHALSC